MAYLFLVNIGPVQPFIASARRTRDLYAGSTLLSELSKAAARAIAEQEGWQQLIFPAPDKLARLDANSSLNVANKIMARILQPPATLAPLVEQAVREHLHAIKDVAYQQVKSTIKEKQASDQVNDLVEFSWVAVPFEESDYARARERVEAILGARKNTRYFQQVNWGDHELKSSIDGQMECVIPADRFPRRSEKGRFPAMSRALYQQYKAGPDERLSGIDLLKRHANFPAMPDVLSTSHIAALPFLHRLNAITDPQAQQNARDHWQSYLNTIKGVVGQQNDVPVTDVLEKVPGPRSHNILGRSDGAMLFEERLLENIPASPAFQTVQAARQQFFDSIEKALNAKVQPTPYYAILLADGDSMGKVIEYQAMGGIERHQMLSRQLDGFANQVEEIVKKHHGAKVYAGGDDVLAFLPLHTVLACAHELATTFVELLKDFTAQDHTVHPTLSVGIAIVHHLSLLQDALDLARDSEQLAKKWRPQKKNALAITVSKRSGEEYSAVGGWEEIYPWLLQWMACYYAGDLSGGAAYELREVTQRLNPAQGDPPSDEQQKGEPDQQAAQDDLERQTLRKIIQIEAVRILRRKLGVPRKKMTKEKEEQIMAAFMKRLSIQKNRSGELVIQQTVSLEPFINELLVAQVLADALKLAGMTPESVTEKEDNA